MPRVQDERVPKFANAAERLEWFRQQTESAARGLFREKISNGEWTDLDITVKGSGIEVAIGDEKTILTDGELIELLSGLSNVVLNNTGRSRFRVHQAQG